MMLQPSSPLSLPKPFGKRVETEFNKINADPKVDAHKKITRAKYSVCAPVSASRTRTPLAGFWLSRCVSPYTMALGRNVMFPVLSAAAGGDARRVQCAPSGQPRMHMLRNWQV